MSLGGQHIRVNSAEGENTPDPQSDTASVLLVDDVENLRTLYRTVLEEKGPFEVVAEAGDGLEGVEAAQEHDPDLVLLDLSMPEMDGLEALPRIREASPGSDVVVLSGFLDERVGREARELGAADYIEKGTDAGELVERAAEAADVELPDPDAEPEADEADDGSGPASQEEGDGDEAELLARGIRHDLKEPLQLVVGHLDLLADGYEDELPAEARDLLEGALDGADRMNRMIDGLGRYQTVDDHVQVEDAVDLGEVLDDALDNLEPRMDGDVVLTRDPLPTVAGDDGALVRVLQNLVANALDHGDGGRIHVGVREEQGQWVVSVADDGPGIPEDEQDAIFSPLNRGSAGRETDGAGMGLAVCHRIVEAHGGEMGVESEPGEGSTFWFTLPKDPPREGGGA